ncbi:MAG: D-alanine--D-alanine ligase [Deltaproteobacteria bacterium]|nr:D-alanine--D-alanine ligase [Deltaproteobacteria bacterium]
MAKVGLVFGGRSVEHEVSLVSARTVALALEQAGHQLVALGVAQDGCWVPRELSERALAGDLDRLEPLGESVSASTHRLLEGGSEVLFPLIHGSGGEDGSLQGLAETLDLPYVGCGVSASAVAMDKVLCKAELERAGVPVVESVSFSKSRFEADSGGCIAETRELPFPLFVKPSLGGSSVGVRKVRDAATLEEAIQFAFQFGDVVLVERGVDGRELECAVLGHRQVRASEVGEIVAGKDFYDYADKYLEEGAQLRAPAPLDPEVSSHLRALAVRSFQAIGGSGLARVDFLLEGEDQLFVNELNTLPGFTSISMFPRLWELSGLSNADLVGLLIGFAFEKHEDRRRLDGGIRDWLASL